MMRMMRSSFVLANLVTLGVLLQPSWSFRKFAVRPRGGRLCSLSEDDEPLFSLYYDPLESPNQLTFERDLEDLLIERGNRFFDQKLVRVNEKCYLVGLDDKSARRRSLSSSSDESNEEMEDCDEGDLEYIPTDDDSSESFEDEYVTVCASVVDGTADGPALAPPDPPTSQHTTFSMEESLAELSELAGAAGLTVVGSTYQRVQSPDIQYYIGVGKTKEIVRNIQKLRCTCVIFDTELSPSQQKNLEVALNSAEANSKKRREGVIKVVDRTALILDIFAQHAKTKEGQLQVQLALLTYRLPRLTNLWSHLERQSAGSKGGSNGGVGLRGPGEKQLESDKREMKAKIATLNRAIDSVRRHRSVHRDRRRRLGLPVIALVGYTNSGKSTLLNTLTCSQEVYTADMLFATLDPTTRLVRLPGMKNPDALFTDTVGFIQKLPTHLIAAFRATLEELQEADVLMHVTDISNDEWRKQEASVLAELSNMGLADKPLITVWNKIDRVPDRKEFIKMEASKRSNTVALSAATREGMDNLATFLQAALGSQMQEFAGYLPYDSPSLAILDVIHRVSVLDVVSYQETTIFIRGSVPAYVYRKILALSVDPSTYVPSTSEFLHEEASRTLSISSSPPRTQKAPRASRGVDLRSRATTAEPPM